MLSAIAARRAQAQAAPGPDIELDKVPIGSKSKAHGLSKQKRKREVSQNAVSGRSTPISVQPQYPSAITIVDRDSEVPVDLDSTQGTSKRQRAYSPSQIPIQSDSDLESEGISDIEVILNPGPSNQLPSGSSNLFISRYSPKFGQNLFTGILSGTIIILRPEEFLGFVGIVEVNVVQGIIEALGTRITDSQPYTIFAPRSHPFPTIRALVSSASIKYALFNEIPQSLKDCIKPDDTVLLLRNHNCGIGGLGTVCKIFDSIFQPSVASTQNEELKLGVDGFYPILKPMPNVYPFIMPDSWSSVLEEIATSTDSAAPSQQHIVAIVKGAKRSGKSTFARTLLNRLLSKYRHVAFLECDVGQSEFTPGGMVSLHVIAHPLLGPSFTHPTRPYRAHFIGSSSPKSSPSHYMASIANLVQTYKMDLQYGLYNMNEQDARDARISTTIPLVVNTQGWAKGMGADLLEEIASLVQPTHEISFDLDPAMDQFGMRSMHMFEVEAPRQGSWAETPDYSQFRSSSQGVVPPKRFVLQPIPITPLSNLFSASDLRSLSIFSYLYARSTEDGYDREDIIWSAPTPLVKMPPYEVEWKTAIDAVVLVGQGAEEVMHDDVHYSITCSLVGLVAVDGGFTSSDVTEVPQTSTSSTIPYVQGAQPPDPAASSCLGLGIIRAVSPSSSTFHMLTPVHPSLLPRCRIIVKGSLELPIWGFIEPTKDLGLKARNGREDERVCGIPWSEVPYLQYGGVQTVGGAVKKARRNLMRRDQM